MGTTGQVAPAPRLEKPESSSPELAQRNWRPSQVSLAACNTTTLRSHCPFLKEAGTLIPSAVGLASWIYLKAP